MAGEQDRLHVKNCESESLKVINLIHNLRSIINSLHLGPSNPRHLSLALPPSQSYTFFFSFKDFIPFLCFYPCVYQPFLTPTLFIHYSLPESPSSANLLHVSIFSITYSTVCCSVSSLLSCLRSHSYSFLQALYPFMLRHFQSLTCSV